MRVISTGAINYCMIGRLTENNQANGEKNYSLSVFAKCPATEETYYISELSKTYTNQLEAKNYLRELRRQWKKIK